MEISLVVYTDWKSFLAIEESWNNFLEDFSENPFFYSRLVGKLMEYWISEGWIPLIFAFWYNNKIIGIVTLKMKKEHYSNYFRNLADELFSDFVFDENYAEICINKLIDYLFENLSCRSGNLILQNNSLYMKLIEKILKKKKLYQSNSKFMGRAIIPLLTSWKDVHGKIKSKVKRELRRLHRKLDDLGSWRISCVKIDSYSIRRILSIEKNSWKNKWREENRIKDYKLHAILQVSKTNDKFKPIFNTEVCFLELENKTLAYLLILSYKNRTFFTKTSYDNKYRIIAPGIFLINSAIEMSFQKRNLKEIDFITDLPFLKIWNPECKPRTKLSIQNSLLLCIVERMGLFFLKIQSEKSLVIKRFEINFLLFKIFSKLGFNF